MDLQRLRRETETEHRAVEGTLPLMHDALDVTQYVRCLKQIYGVVAAWEERAFEVAPPWLRLTLIARQRKDLLDLDFAWFGEPERVKLRPTMPAMNDLPSLLGTMYVMEGSTLGGQLIARHVEATLHLPDGHGSAYFRGHGDRTGRMWKEFCALLNDRVTEEQTDGVIESAKAMFRTYGSWMKEKSVMNAS